MPIYTIRNEKAAGNGKLSGVVVETKKGQSRPSYIPGGCQLERVTP